MNILYRTPSTAHGTFGILFIDDIPFCVMLERSSDGEYPCIPMGTYQCSRFKSPHNGDVWLLKDVPGRSMIEIHAANIYTELKGCLAPGRRFGLLGNLPAVLESGPAMGDLYKKLGDNFILTIKE